MMKSVSVLVCLLLPLLFVGSVLLAQEPAVDEESKKKAQAAFNRGRASFEQQRYIEAAEAFREAYEMMPSWKLLYNIGQAETAAGRYGLALDSFERYLAVGGDEVPSDRKEEVIAEITRLRAMVGFLDVKAPDGAIVYVDNMKRGTAPLPGRVKVTAGIEHTVFVEKDSLSIFTRTVIVSGGETITVEARMLESAPIEVKVEEPGAPPPAVSTPEEKKKSPFFLSGWILTGTGAGILLGGGIAGIIAVKTTKDLEGVCDSDGTCPESRQGDIDRANASSLAASILIPAGAVIAAAGVVLVILDRVKNKETANVSFVPVTAPGFGGFQVQGRF